MPDAAKTEEPKLQVGDWVRFRSRAGYLGRVVRVRDAVRDAASAGGLRMVDVIDGTGKTAVVEKFREDVLVRIPEAPRFRCGDLVTLQDDGSGYPTNGQWKVHGLQWKVHGTNPNSDRYLYEVALSSTGGSRIIDVPFTALTLLPGTRRFHLGDYVDVMETDSTVGAVNGRTRFTGFITGEVTNSTWCVTAFESNVARVGVLTAAMRLHQPEAARNAEPQYRVCDKVIVRNATGVAEHGVIHQMTWHGRREPGRQYLYDVVTDSRHVVLGVPADGLRPVPPAQTHFRHLTAHIYDRNADPVRVTPLDAPGAGGAHHVYGVSWIPRQWVQDGARPLADCTTIRFQNGPLPENGVNGLTNEVLLAILEDRLLCFENGPYPSAYNADALDHVRKALQALHDRTADRQRRGVEGAHKA